MLYSLYPFSSRYLGYISYAGLIAGSSFRILGIGPLAIISLRVRALVRLTLPNQNLWATSEVMDISTVALVSVSWGRTSISSPEQSTTITRSGSVYLNRIIILDLS